MRYSALIAASLASNAFASPLHKRVYVTDIDLVTITKYVTATGPCPTTAETSTVAVTQEAVTSSQVVIVSTVSSAAPVVESSSEAPAPVETTSVAAPVTTSSALVEVSVSLAPSSTVVPETTATPSTSAVPTTTAAPTSSEVAGGFSFPAACPTTSLDSTASLTAQPTGAAAQRWLAFHNAHRANHTDGCSLLWDYDLEAKAQASAAKCIYDHDNTSVPLWLSCLMPFADGLSIAMMTGVRTWVKCNTA